MSFLKDKCPFGEVCRKEIVCIGENKFCFGQLYSQEINYDKLVEAAKQRKVQILDADGTLWLHLNENYDEQLISEYFFGRYELYILMDFGNTKNKNGLIYGERLLSELCYG